MNFTKISWEKLEKDCIALAKKINGTTIDEIVSISRGGTVVARMLSDFLDLPISHIAIKSYADLKQEKEPIITQMSPREFKGETILLVDELSDSGKTFIRGISYLNELPIRKIFTTAPYYKPQTVHIPDFWVEELDTWIIFPYEVRETYESFVKEFSSETLAKEKMRELGFHEWEIDQKT